MISLQDITFLTPEVKLKQFHNSTMNIIIAHVCDVELDRERERERQEKEEDRVQREIEKNLEREKSSKES